MYVYINIVVFFGCYNPAFFLKYYQWTILFNSAHTNTQAAKHKPKATSDTHYNFQHCLLLHIRKIFKSEGDLLKESFVLQFVCSFRRILIVFKVQRLRNHTFGAIHNLDNIIQASPVQSSTSHIFSPLVPGIRYRKWHENRRQYQRR